jgi:predicted NAD/FAD-binding protein
MLDIHSHIFQIVFNPPTYPNFLRFLKLYPPLDDGLLKSSSPTLLDPTHAPEKGIRILETEMSFSVSRDAGIFEWAGKKDPFAIFCQPGRVLDPHMWRMLYDVLRFNACAPQILTKSDCRGISIGQYLDQEGYSNAFRDNYLMVFRLAR